MPATASMQATSQNTDAKPAWRGRVLRLAVGAFAALRVAFLVALGLALVAAITGIVLLSTNPSCSGMSDVYNACTRENRPTELLGVGLVAGGLTLAGSLLGLVLGVSAPRWHGRRWGRRHLRQLDDARGWHADGRLPRESFASYEAAFKAFRDGRTGPQVALALGGGLVAVGALLTVTTLGMFLFTHDAQRDAAQVAVRAVALGLVAPALVTLGAGVVVAVAAAHARRQHAEAMDAALLDLASQANRARPAGRARDRPV